MIKGRGLSPGLASAKAVVCDQYISPLGELGLDGYISAGPCEGSLVSGKIFIFRGGRGSTVGSYIFLQLKESGKAPAGIINELGEQIVVTGAIISDLPMVDLMPIDIFVNGDTVTVNGSTGEVKIENVEEKMVATAYVVRNGRLLVMKRSDSAPTYAGMYGGVSGYIEEGEHPEDTARREVAEEASLTDLKLLEIGKEVQVRYGQTLFRITPVLMSSVSGDVKLNYENSSYFWVTRDELQGLETVPKFKEVFDSLLNSKSLK
ncbi:MAG: DUF126 domain-containing protein [Thermoplasmatales archaeon]